MSLYGILFTASLNRCHSRQLTEASPFFTAENQIIRGCFLQHPQKVSSARKRSFDLATDNSFETTAFTNRFLQVCLVPVLCQKVISGASLCLCLKSLVLIHILQATGLQMSVILKKKCCIFKCSTLQSIQYCFGT